MSSQRRSYVALHSHYLLGHRHALQFPGSPLDAIERGKPLMTFKLLIDDKCRPGVSVRKFSDMARIAWELQTAVTDGKENEGVLFVQVRLDVTFTNFSHLSDREPSPNSNCITRDHQ